MDDHRTPDEVAQNLTRMEVLKKVVRERMKTPYEPNDPPLFYFKEHDKEPPTLALSVARCVGLFVSSDPELANQLRDWVAGKLVEPANRDT
jgi:hypothetical protein